MDLPSLAEVVEAILAMAASLVVGEALIRLVASAAQRAGFTASEKRTIRNVVTVMWVSVGAFLALRALNVTSDVTTLTFSGVFGIGLTLALQATLTNIISGMLLIVDGTIRLDDQIEYSGVKGQVVLMGFRSTWIRTDDGSIAVVSNSSLISGPVLNHSGAQRLERRLQG